MRANTRSLERGETGWRLGSVRQVAICEAGSGQLIRENVGRDEVELVGVGQVERHGRFDSLTDRVC